LKSSISALESSLNTLEGLSTPWEWLAIVSSFVVVFGIFGEIVVIVSEDREDEKDWARGILWPPDRSPRWRFWFDIVATIVVLLGVLGETWGSFELASINSHLRSKTSELRAQSDQLLALVTEEAGSAANSAKVAGDAASTAKTEADGAKTTSEDALNTASAAREGANSVKLDIAAAKAELLRMNTSRSLLVNHKLIQSLVPFIRTEYTLTVFRDEDSRKLLGSIAILLDAAGWVRKQPVGVSPGTNSLSLWIDKGSLENVGECSETGISLIVHVQESLDTLWRHSPEAQPKSIKAGTALVTLLQANISPEDSRNVKPLLNDPGEQIGAAPMDICVGRKP
jgi:hypothetical protein